MHLCPCPAPASPVIIPPCPVYSKVHLGRSLCSQTAVISTRLWRMMLESSPAWQILQMRADHLYTGELFHQSNSEHWSVPIWAIIETFQARKLKNGDIFSDGYHPIIPLPVFYLPLYNHGQCVTFRMTKWRENMLAFVCAHVGVRECTRRVKKICQMLNNGLECVKMNTVIGINDLMGA